MYNTHKADQSKTCIEKTVKAKPPWDQHFCWNRQVFGLYRKFPQRFTTLGLYFLSCIPKCNCIVYHFS